MTRYEQFFTNTAEEFLPTMPSDLTILRATSEHIDQLTPLFDAYRQFYGQRTDMRSAQQYLQKRFDDNAMTVFMAFVGARAIGFVLMYPSFSSVSMAPIWILNDVYVAKEERRQGAGVALLERCQMYAIETGYRGITLATATNNVTAQHIYERMGWRRDRSFYHYEWFTPMA